MGLDINVLTEDGLCIGYFRQYWAVVEDFNLESCEDKKISLKKFKKWAKAKNWADRTTNEVKYPLWIYQSCAYTLQEEEDCIAEDSPAFNAFNEMEEDEAWHNMIFNIIQQAEENGETHIILHAWW